MCCGRQAPEQSRQSLWFEFNEQWLNIFMSHLRAMFILVSCLNPWTLASGKVCLCVVSGLMVLRYVATLWKYHFFSEEVNFHIWHSKNVRTFIILVHRKVRLHLVLFKSYGLFCDCPQTKDDMFEKLNSSFSWNLISVVLRCAKGRNFWTNRYFLIKLSMLLAKTLTCAINYIIENDE